MTAAAAIALIAAAGCRDDPGAPHACACSYLTDWDDEGTIHEIVCAPTPDRAAAVARGCAARSAPAPVTSCACAKADAPPRGGVPCRTGDCLSPVGRE